ncbi:redoxin domain-containing protein [Chitinophaga oryziterrae]
MLGIAFSYSHAQQMKKTPYPNVGEKLANYTFTDLVNYPKSTASLNDFRGKWLILDFWGYSCSACVASFPKMDHYAEKFKDQLQIVMVGATKSSPKDDRKRIEKITKDLYQHLDAKYHLKLTVAFDSVLYLKYDVGSLPHILIIDPQGVIRVKTYQLFENQIVDLLAGKSPSFDRSFSRSEPREKENDHANTYNNSVPLLATQKEANDSSYLFRSTLRQWTVSMPLAQVVSLFDQHMKSVKNGKLEVFNNLMEGLYRIAYFGIDDWDVWDDENYNKRYRSLYLNIRDSTYFKSNRPMTFAYSLSVPKDRSSPELIMKAMQLDLNKFFGYKATKEIRKMPVYAFVISDSAKVRALISKNKNPALKKTTYDHLHLVNFPIGDFIKHLTVRMHLDIPVINSTGMSGPIDIDFKANLLDPDDIQKNLEVYGFKLVKTTKDMEVIVLSDDDELISTPSIFVKK